MINTYFFDAKKACLTIVLDSGETEDIYPDFEKFLTNPENLPYNSSGPVQILASLVVDLVKRVEALEILNV